MGDAGQGPSRKLDLKRELRHLYAPGREPSLVEVPELSFLMIDGQDDPNTSPEYQQAIEALYSVAYTAKFTLKRAPDGLDFAVMPLESLWWAPGAESFAMASKSEWRWTAMIVQPDAVTPELFEQAREAASAKRALPALELMRLERYAEGAAAQVMYVGPYSEEGPTIERLHAFIAEQGCAPAGKHHEIYLGDPRRSAPEKLKTVIRQPVVAVAGATRRADANVAGGATGV